MLRPFDITSAVDTAFRLYGEHRVLVFSLSLLAAVPAALGWVAVDAVAGRVRLPPSALKAGWPGAGGSLPLVSSGLYAAIALALTTLTSTVGIAAASLVVSRLAAGAPLTFGAAVGRLARSIAALTGVSLATAAVVILGLAAAVVPGLVVLVGIAFVGPALVLEGRRPLAAVARSWRLTRGRRLKLAGVLGLCGLVVASATGGLTAVGSITGVLGDGLAGTLVSALLTQAVAAAGAPVLYLAMALLYFDARVEIEGLDVLVVTAGSPASRGPGWSP